MKKWKWIVFGVVCVSAIVYFNVQPTLKVKNLEFTYTFLEKGNIESLVSSTGALEAINTVEVGTQISGTIKKIYVDYNDKVTAGQLLAEMDLSLLNTNLNSAKANLAVSVAQFNHANDEFERAKKLYRLGVISEQEYQNVKYNFEQATSAKKAVLAAKKNIEVSIDYAHIRSPINGTITERSVEEGQTVAASFATPTLFIIAEDLAKMQIVADVDECDIGFIKNNMKARFTVQTYPEKEFYGQVSQIRMQPVKINNVVNYQVVIDVDNKEKLLLPGMTTSIEFIMNVAKNVLLVNNSALRFRPSEAMLEEMKPLLLNHGKAYLPDSIQLKFSNAITNEELYSPATFKKQLPSGIDGFFMKSDNGTLEFKFIEIGIKTGLQSEIESFLDAIPLEEGTKVINGIKSKK